ITPGLLLALTFALGVGSALAAPTWASLVPDVVGRPQVAAAISANSLSYNVARAVGPSLGGALVVAVGPAGTFVANAISLLVPIGVLSRWRMAASVRGSSTSGRERFMRAVLTGIEYVWRAE